MTTAASQALATHLLKMVPSVWMQLHVGPPGPDGTRNPAVEFHRQIVRWAEPVDARRVSVNDQVFVGVAASEEYTHWTGWSSSIAGEFLLSGLISAPAVDSGDTFTVPAGATVMTFPTAS